MPAHSQGFGYLPERVPPWDYAPEDLDVLRLTRNDWENLCTELEGKVQEALDRLNKIIS